MTEKILTLQFRAGKIHSSSMRRGARANNHNLAMHPSLLAPVQETRRTAAIRFGYRLLLYARRCCNAQS
jgi:hypothetical protein